MSETWPKLPEAPDTPGLYWLLVENCRPDEEADLVRIYRWCDEYGRDCHGDPEELWCDPVGGCDANGLRVADVKGHWWGPVHPPKVEIT